MAESRGSADEVGVDTHSRADDDQYDSADSGGYEVRDETGSDPDPRDVTETIHTFGMPPKTVKNMNQGKVDIEHVVKETLQGYIPSILKEMVGNNGDPNLRGTSNNTKNVTSRTWDHNTREWTKRDPSPESLGYQADNQSGYNRNIPNTYVPDEIFENRFETYDRDFQQGRYFERDTYGGQTPPLPSGYYNQRNRVGYTGPSPGPRRGPIRPNSGRRFRDYQHDVSDDYYYREDLSVKVRPFFERETDWFTYKTHFEAVASQAGWSAKTKCLKLMAALQGSLTGITAGMKHPFRYEQLVARLDAVHGISNDRKDALIKLGNCRKGQDESIPMFGERVRQLVERAYPNYNAQDKDEQSLRVFLNGLPSRHDIRLTMKLKGFRALREAVPYGARLEQIIASERGFENKKGANFRAIEHLGDATNQIDQSKEDLTELISKVCKQVITESKEVAKSGDSGKENKAKIVKKTPQNSPCHICSELGHWANECPSKSDQSRLRAKQQSQTTNGEKCLNSTGSPLGGK